QHFSVGRINRSHGSVVACLALIEVLLWNQAVLVKTLAAVKIELGLLKVGLLRQQISLGGLVTRFRRSNSRLGGIQRGSLRLNVSIGLNSVLHQQAIALLDLVAFLDEDLRNASEALSLHVGVCRGLDCAGGCNQRYQRVLLHHLCGLDGGDALVRLIHAVNDNPSPDHHDGGSDRHFLPHLHRSWFLFATTACLPALTGNHLPGKTRKPRNFFASSYSYALCERNVSPEGCRASLDRDDVGTPSPSTYSKEHGPSRTTLKRGPEPSILETIS